MSLLRRVRAELTGAWRSVRYDMGRKPAEPTRGGPDVTSTGMNTFGGALPDRPARRRPRKVVAVTAFGVLTVVGSTGAYLGIVNGLGSLLDETPAAAGTLGAPPEATSTVTPKAGIGRGPVSGRAGSPRTQAAGTRPAPDAPSPDPTNPKPSSGTPENVSPIRTSPTPKSPKSTKSPRARGIPVPTPTMPNSGSSGSHGSQGSQSWQGLHGSQGSATPPGSVTPSVSASADETSATPGDSVDPDETWQYWRRRRHG